MSASTSSGAEAAAQPAAESGRYRPDIDGLRAIAVLAVVGFHAFPDWVQGGFVGVDIFFVISGYLISTIILRNLGQGSFSYVRFYIRRINRVFPALLLVLAASLAFGWLVLLPFEYKLFGKQVAAAAGFASNFLLWSESGYFHLDSESKPLLHLWSLGIEEQFYLVWPLFLGFAWRRKWNVLAAIGVVALTSFACDQYVVGHNTVAAFFSPATRFWELLSGGLLAWLELRPDTQMRAGESLKSIAGIALLAASLVLIDRTRPYPDWLALLPCLGTFLLISAGPDTWLNRQVLSHKALVWFGLISYPLYLWHWPLLAFARILNSAPPHAGTRAGLCLASVPLAWLTYRFVERPIRFGPNAAIKALALLGLLVVIGVLGAGVYVSGGFASRTVIGQERAAVVIDKDMPGRPGCDRRAQLPSVLAGICVAHLNAGAKSKVVLWGDSHIGVWGPVLQRLARDRGFELYVFRHDGCPPIEGIRRSDTRDSLAICGTLDTMNDIESAIIELKPDLAVLTARWSLYSHGWIRNGELLEANSLLTTAPDEMATIDSSKRALARQIPESVGQLQAHGIRVAVIKNPPVLKWEVTNVRKSIQDIEVSAAEHAAYSRFTDDIFARLPGVAIFDPAPGLCKGACAVQRDGKYLYVDDNHLSAAGAAPFEAEIGALIDRELRVGR